MLPHPVEIPVQVVHLKIALEIFYVSQTHHALPISPFSVERVGKKQHLPALCHVKVAQVLTAQLENHVLATLHV